MRRKSPISLFVLALLPLLSGCFGGHKDSAQKQPSATELEAVRRRAIGLGPSSTPEVAPEPVAKAKLLKRGEGCTWVESVGRVVVGENETRHQASAAARDEARKSAMQDLLGVEVKSKLLDFQQEGFRSDAQLTESVLQTTRNGLILDEKIVSEGYQDVGDCKGCRYEATIQACIAEAAQPDKDFQVQLKLSRTRLIAGDEAKVQITATKDCYLYLYDVWGDWQTAMIAPNERVTEVRLKAGDTFFYPDEELRKSGIKLVAELPEGRKVSAETIRVIASRTPLPRNVNDPAFGGYLGILRRLHSSKLDWSDDAEAFTIYAE